MKLPSLKLPSLKLPSIKFSLPKLGGGGLLGRFRRAKSNENEEDEEGLDDLDKAENKAAAGDSEDGLDGDDEDLDGDEAGPSGNKRRLILIVAAVPMVLGLIGGIVWFFLSGNGDAEKVAADAAMSSQNTAKSMVVQSGPMTPPAAGIEGVPRVISVLPPRGSTGLLTPPGSADGAVSTTETNPPGGVGVEDPQLGLMISAATPASFVATPELPASPSLPTAPAEGLFEQSENGILPRVGIDGRLPWQVYARPFQGASDLPRIAVIVRDLGLSRAATDATIRRLPADVTLAFSPYAQGVSDWARFARERGHETLLSLPMEPREFPVYDPGPYALRTLASPQDNIRLLEFVLGRAAGYVGVMGTFGSKFVQNAEQLKPALSHLKVRGLMFIDGSLTTGSLAPEIASQLSLPRAVVDLGMDDGLSRAAIEVFLAEVEDISKKKAVAVVVIGPSPVAIELLANWVQTLESKGLILAPISALADKQIF